MNKMGMDLADIAEMNAHSMVKYRERAGRYNPKAASSFVAMLRLAEKTLPRNVNQDQRWVIRLCHEDGGHELESGVIVWPPRWPE